MEIKRFDHFINESELNEQVDWWEMAKTAFFGPLAAASPEKAKEIVKGALLGPLLATESGQAAIKNMLDKTPAGIIKNMSIAASKGDATNFKTAWTAAQKYSANETKKLEKAAFQDMKAFGSTLQKMGF